MRCEVCKGKGITSILLKNWGFSGWDAKKFFLCDQCRGSGEI